MSSHQLVPAASRLGFIY